MSLLPFVAAVLAAFALPCVAQTPDCGSASTQADMTICAEIDSQQADKRLNAAYRTARSWAQAIDADLADDQRGAAASLLTAQRAWVTFRDAECDAEGYAMHGGTAEPMVVYGCRARLTEVRTQELEDMIGEN